VRSILPQYLYSKPSGSQATNMSPSSTRVEGLNCTDAFHDLDAPLHGQCPLTDSPVASPNSPTSEEDESLNSSTSTSCIPPVAYPSRSPRRRRARRPEDILTRSPDRPQPERPPNPLLYSDMYHITIVSRRGTEKEHRRLGPDGRTVLWNVRLALTTGPHVARPFPTCKT